MSLRVIYQEQEQTIKSMASNFTMKQIAGSLNINYKTIHAWFHRNKITPFNGNGGSHPEISVVIKNLPSPYVIPGLITNLLTLDQMAVLKEKKILPSLDLIKKTVCNYCAITEDEFHDKCRKRTFAWARQVFYYLSVNLTKNNYTHIGYYTNKDHTTVIYGVQVVKDIIKYDKDKEREVREIAGIIDNIMKDEKTKLIINNG